MKAFFADATGKNGNEKWQVNEPVVFYFFIVFLAVNSMHKVDTNDIVYS